MPLLTSAELDQFSHDGWLALPGILGERYSQEIRADIDEIMLAFDTTDGSDSRPLAARRAQLPHHRDRRAPRAGR